MHQLARWTLIEILKNQTQPRHCVGRREASCCEKHLEGLGSLAFIDLIIIDIFSDTSTFLVVPQCSC